MTYCLDKLVVDHELNVAQRQFLGLGIAHCCAAFYTTCYGMFYIFLTRIAETESGRGLSYISALYIGFGIWYFMLGGMALSVTGKNPPLCPIQSGCGLSVLTIKLIIAACIITGLDLSGMESPNGGLLTTSNLLEICPKEVFVATTSLMMIFHVVEFLLVCVQIGAVSRLKLASRSQIMYVQRPTTTAIGYNQFVISNHQNTINNVNVPSAQPTVSAVHQGRIRRPERFGYPNQFQGAIPPNCDIIRVSTTRAVQYS